MELPDELTHRGPFDFETGFTGAGRLLALDEPPTVIVCANDVVALRRVQRRPLAGPRRARARCRSSASTTCPRQRWPLLQITTVAFDLEAMARRGAALLVDRMGAGASEPYKHEWFPSHLVERATLGPVPTDAH